MSSPHPASRHRRRLTGSHNDKPPVGICRTYHPTLLTRVRSSPEAFIDLPCSVSDAAQFYQAEEGSSTEKLFWSQYTGTEHLMPVSDQLKQLVELHKAAEQAMRAL